jgi:hypothetical protein
MKHMRSKKQCLERHNMGHVDPTIVQKLPMFGEQAAVSVNSITFHPNQDDNHHQGQSTNNSYVNSYATYAFPHSTNSTSVPSTMLQGGRTSVPSTMLQGGQRGNVYQISGSMPPMNEHDANFAQFSLYQDNDLSDDSSRGNEHLLENLSFEEDDSWLPNSSSTEEYFSDEEEDDLYARESILSRVTYNVVVGIRLAKEYQSP